MRIKSLVAGSLRDNGAAAGGQESFSRLFYARMVDGPAAE